MSAVSYGERFRRVPAVGLPAPARNFLYVTCAAAIGAAAVTTTASAGHVRWKVFAVLLVAGAAAQLFATHTPGNQVFHTGIAFAVAAALLLPPQLVVVVCVAQHVPEWLRQRYPWFIQSFNMANVVLSALAAWSLRAVLAKNGVHVTAAATTSAVVVASAAAVTFVFVNHALLARMLRLARGHDLSASGLFTFDGLIEDGVVALVGVGVAFVLLNSWALAVVVAVPLVLIQRALALPTLREQALSDHKTGLLNSRGIDQPARGEFARARRLGRALSVLLCDVDDMRGINNNYGHLEGDAALAAVAAAFRAELRAYDLCARFGGDEFLVVLPETDEAEAVAVAGRIQAWLADHPLSTRDGKVAVGVSIGVGTLHEGEPEIGTLMSRADAAMYAEKHAGRRSFLTVG
ncbi:MAG TPA: GGDEF domain-containing protein [Gaiellaceae bacterium]|jgi:diguanylate cyclase (GGDEF)-like protein|nr:GGDEF domain-containing protein [Gaiellaceae bacterium]